MNDYAQSKLCFVKDDCMYFTSNLDIQDGSGWDVSPFMDSAHEPDEDMCDIYRMYSPHIWMANPYRSIDSRHRSVLEINQSRAAWLMFDNENDSHYQFINAGASPIEVRNQLKQWGFDTYTLAANLPTNWYQESVTRTMNGFELANYALGLAGETGEVVEQIKKHIYHDKELNLEKMSEELGDVCWYVAALLNSLDLSLEDVLNNNIEKLFSRYPNGFKPNKG